MEIDKKKCILMQKAKQAAASVSLVVTLNTYAFYHFDIFHMW